jgi:hypothetical protein
VFCPVPGWPSTVLSVVAPVPSARKRAEEGVRHPSGGFRARPLSFARTEVPHSIATKPMRTATLMIWKGRADVECKGGIGPLFFFFIKSHHRSAAASLPPSAASSTMMRAAAAHA